MTPPNEGKATRREWIGLGIIALPCILYSMDLSVLNLAVPHLSADLKPSGAELLWIVDVYGFLLAGFLITMGTLGDRIGRRRLLLIGAAAFGAASVLAAFSTTSGMLIAARALLGVAGATLAPSTLSLIRNMFLDPKERTVAIGVWIASFSAGGALGPLVGGILLTWFWWGSVFLIAVPIMVGLLVLGPVFLPEYRDPKAGRLDVTSTALSLASVLPVIWGIKRLAEAGPGWLAAGAIAIGLVVGAVFLRRQRRLSDPMVDPKLFRSAAFSVSLGINVLGFFVAFGSFLFVAQYLQSVLAMEPLEAGLWTLPAGIMFVVGAMLAPALVARLGPVRVILSGLVFASSGFFLLSGFAGPVGLGLLVAGFSVYSLGLAPVFTLSTDLIVGTVPPEQAGVASGMGETSSEFGGALGIAVLGSLIMAVYRSAMLDIRPDGLPPEALATARDTLGGAIAVAQTLPGATGDRILAAARDAFVEGFQLSALICAVVLLVAALLAGAFLRERQPVADPAGTGGS